MNGWQTVTVILGIAAVIASTYASIWTLKNRQSEPAALEQAINERMAKVEAHVEHQQQNFKRFETEAKDSRRRQETVVDGIYTAIDGLRNEVIELIKRNKT